MNIFDDLFNIDDNVNYAVSGLNSELYSLYIYNKFKKCNKSMIVVTNSLYEASNLFDKISDFSNDVVLFPMDDFLTSEATIISPELMIERINTLDSICKKEKVILITNLMGYLRYLPNKKLWLKSYIELKKGMSIDRELLINKLYNSGYERETIVNESGRFGVRGYVIDIFPTLDNNPVRIEFWGDTIESIKYFDVQSQLSNKEIDCVLIPPFSEFIVEDKNIDVIKKQKYLLHYDKNVCNISEYLSDFILVYYDYNQIMGGYEILLKTMFEYDSTANNEFKTEYMFRLDDFNPQKELFLLTFDNSVSNRPDIEKYIRYSSSKIHNYMGDYNSFSKDLMSYIQNGKTVIICLNGSNEIKRVTRYISGCSYLITSKNNIVSNKVNIIDFHLSSGFIFNDVVVIARSDLFSTSNKVYKGRYKSGGKIDNTINLCIGDFVVHEQFGIGIYKGLCTITRNGILKDYIKVMYANDDSLYIPVEKIDRITKFSGKEGSRLVVNKLGTTDWQKKKNKIRKKLNDIAGDLIKVSAEREAMKGFSFSIEDENQVIFDNNFAYSETDDQLKAINSIKKEMERPKPMDMLLCGDVGYGKTEVAFRAMFKAVNNGKQVAYLCPTTVLSIQQYKSALERFSSFPVNISLLNRFVSIKDQKLILEKLANGSIDIVFGTHRLLGNDVVFKDLGLLVIDEEQRFGVTHKEKIKKCKSNIDVLTLSATPIPRTLQMSMTGVRSLALIETPPAQRYPIQTYVMEENDIIVRDAIYKELSRNGQVFVLYNRVESIENKVRNIKRLVPEAKIDIAHGQMEKGQIEKKMLDFTEHKFDVLVCTTIIETGIDIPNANTLIILNADKFGLSQLYQIRGRIGRSNKIGYAYLMYDGNKVLNENASKRLETIKEFTELGSGFKIAMRDLSIRGAGDILGREQSGFIDAIGIDLYLKMLNEEIRKLKGEENVDDTDNVNNMPLINIETHISDSYVSDVDLKIEIHKMINTVDSYNKMEKVKKELIDRFGNISENIEIYMYEEWFEKLASRLGITDVKQNCSFIDITLPENVLKFIDVSDLFVMAYNVSRHFRFTTSKNNVHIILDIVNLEKHFLIYLIEFFDKVANYVK